MESKRIQRRQRRLELQMKIRWIWRGILCFIGRFQKPREVIYEESHGRRYPICPRCHELVYYKNKCCFCGLPFKEGAWTVGSVLDDDWHP